MHGSTTASMPDAMREWVTENPLRKWRLTHQYGLIFTASVLQVGVWSVQQWERGSTYPNQESRARIKEVTRQPDLDDLWVAWWNGRPRFN